MALSLMGRGNDKEDHSNRRPGNRLVDDARFLARLNLAMADAAIGCWEAKYTYSFWRPVTAIHEAAADANSATTPDANWQPLFATPPHPDHPSGHSCNSGAAGAILQEQFGNKTRFTIDSDLMPGVIRSFRSFSSALEEVKNARIFAGIHFRSACDAGQELGIAVANFVLDRSMLRLR